MAWTPQKFSSVPVEDIRASTLDFKQFILRCLDRMDMVIPECVKADDYTIIRAKMRFLSSGARFYFRNDEPFKKKVKDIEEQLRKISSNDYAYFSLLMEWLEEISLRFQVMEVIPPISGGTIVERGNYPLSSIIERGDYKNGESTQATAHSE